jgi:DNA modification methylase
MVVNGSKTSGLNGERYERKTAHKNNHPTVKPTALMRYLCRLITPAGGTVLDPYMGSGSTGKAAMLEGFSFVGCEIDDNYFDIARSRIENATAL